MPFSMSYGEPQTPEPDKAAPAPKRRRAAATTAASATPAADRPSRRDTLKDKAEALFEPGAAPEADAEADSQG